MNIEWIKNKSNEKFYPISHESAILCGDDSAQTLADKLDKYIVKQYGVAERLFTIQGSQKTVTSIMSSYITTPFIKIGGNDNIIQATKNGTRVLIEDGTVTENTTVESELKLNPNGGDVTVNGNSVLHKGNSVAMIVDATEPSDTSVIWWDTTTNLIKRYADGTWIAAANA